MTSKQKRKLNKLSFYLLLACLLSAFFHIYPKAAEVFDLKKPFWTQISMPTLPNFNFKQINKEKKGIIIATEPEFYNSPQKDEPIESDLQTGEEVSIIQEENGWIQLKTSYGNLWTPSENVLIPSL